MQQLATLDSRHVLLLVRFSFVSFMVDSEFYVHAITVVMRSEDLQCCIHHLRDIFSWVDCFVVHVNCANYY